MFPTKILSFPLRQCSNARRKPQCFKKDARELSSYTKLLQTSMSSFLCQKLRTTPGLRHFLTMPSWYVKMVTEWVYNIWVVNSHTVGFWKFWGLLNVWQNRCCHPIWSWSTPPWFETGLPKRKRSCRSPTQPQSRGIHPFNHQSKSIYSKNQMMFILLPSHERRVNKASKRHFISICSCKFHQLSPSYNRQAGSVISTLKQWPFPLFQSPVERLSFSFLR